MALVLIYLFKIIFFNEHFSCGFINGRKSYNKYFLGVPRQLAGRAFRSNLFGEEKSPKRISASFPNALNEQLKMNKE
jgi:hypothetical protein